MTILQWRERPAERSVWECLCGARAFRLLEGGCIECIECDASQTPKHFDPEVPKPRRRLRGVGSCGECKSRTYTLQGKLSHKPGCSARVAGIYVTEIPAEAMQGDTLDWSKVPK
jgi:hypothetical protein